MEKKYYNEAIIGNEKIVASFSTKGELLRLFYPNRDCRQFIDEMKTGLRVNDSMLINLHDDINNQYNQYYTENTNILNTKIKNTYFNLSILQTDFVSIGKDVIIKKYVVKNENTIDLEVDFLIYSKLLSSFNNMVSTLIQNDIFMQHSHNYTYCIFSKSPIENHRLNNSKNQFREAYLQDKDYEGMANDSALSYNLGVLKPGEEKELEIFIYINNNREKFQIDEIIKDVEKMRKIDVNKELKEVEKYWKKFVKDYDGLEILSKKEKWEKLITGQSKLNAYTDEEYTEMKKIYVRSILLFPLLSNSQTGGISAALEVDEEKDKSGRYMYCWPRDAVFITRALDILKMTKETEKFYKIFSEKTQSKNGMWEQRFYTDGKLAPCWGYQIDETASIVYGVFGHYKVVKDVKFLQDTYKMCKKAVEYLKKYIDFIITNEAYSGERFETHESYDIWEMHEGVHLYSLSAIYAAFTSFIEIEKILEKEENNKQGEKIKRDKKIDVSELKKYSEKIKEYIMNNLVDYTTKTLKRNTKDNVSDISIIGAAIPFNVVDFESEEVKNTIEKLDMHLKTYTGGYLRFENDSYIGGNNPWVISTLWMALYNMKIKNIGDARKEIKFVMQTASEHGFLAEQIDNESMQPKWVTGLGWSHAMYIIALASL